MDATIKDIHILFYGRLYRFKLYFDVINTHWNPFILIFPTFSSSIVVLDSHWSSYHHIFMIIVPKYIMVPYSSHDQIVTFWHRLKDNEEDLEGTNHYLWSMICIGIHHILYFYLHHCGLKHLILLWELLTSTWRCLSRVPRHHTSWFFLSHIHFKIGKMTCILMWFYLFLRGGLLFSKIRLDSTFIFGYLLLLQEILQWWGLQCITPLF